MELQKVGSSDFLSGHVRGMKAKLQGSVIFIANEIHYATSPSGAAWTQDLRMPPRWGLEPSKRASGSINMALRWRHQPLAGGELFQ